MANYQTLDLFPKTFVGNLTAVGNSGTAFARGVNALQNNPAGIGKTLGTEILFFMESEYYSYKLLNYLHQRNLGRIFNHGEFKPVYPNFIIKTQISNQIGIGIGYVDYISPFLINSKRAITWSTLYNQKTSGAIYGLIASIGYSYNSYTSFGINLTKYNGEIESVIHGDNHSNDKDKWLIQNSILSGWNMQIGMQRNFRKLDLGFSISLPLNLNTNIKYDISSDSVYIQLIPKETNPSLHFPLNVSAGFAYTYSNSWQFLLDVKTYRVTESNLKLIIFEYGGKVSWRDGIGFNTGTIYTFHNKSKIPIKCGYANRPQMYTSITSSSSGSRIVKYKNEKINRRHIFSFGSEIKKTNLTIDYGVKYSFLKWYRNNDISGFKIEDEYLEKQYSAFVNFVLRFKR